MTNPAPQGDAGWYPDGWINPADDPELPWITHPGEDADDPAPPEERLAREPEQVAAEPSGEPHPQLVKELLHHPELPPGARTAAPGVPGINLGDYSLSPQQKGWGAPCAAAHATVSLPSGARVTVDARIAELVGLIMRANEAQGYSYRPADTGAYNCRRIAGSSAWSNHAWALAIDANWQTNPMTRPLRTDRPRWELDRWNRYGFAWGGDYLPPTACDAMHTEAMGTPAQMLSALLLARAELGGVQPAPDPQPWLALPNLVRGQASAATERWQAWWNAYPFVPALLPIIRPLSTMFGPQTDAAVRKTQARYGLAADGIVGPLTKHLFWTLGWRG